MKEQIIWAFHNVVAHPVSELCYWLSILCPPIRNFGNWLHDWSVPANHKEGRG